MKYKILEYSLLNSNLKYRLNDKKIYLEYEGFLFNNSKIPFSLNILIDEDGELKTNLGIEIEKINQNEYKINYPDGRYDNVIAIYYYLDDSNERISVDKEDVIVKPDGSLWYLGHEVRIYYKNENGLIISNDYKDFIDNDKYLFDDEKIIDIRQEIFNIRSRIKDIEFNKIEYNKYNDFDYNNYLSSLMEYDRKSLDHMYAQIVKNNELKEVYDDYYDLRNDYYELTKKELKSAYGITGNPTVASSSVMQYLYKAHNGYGMDLFRLQAYYKSNPNDLAPFENLRSDDKTSKYYEQEFNREIETINQQLLYKTNALEKNGWIKQKIINNAFYELYTKNVNLISKKNTYENKIKNLTEEYYEICLVISDEELEYYNKLLKEKEYLLNKYINETPKMYLVNKNTEIIYGFNEFNKLCIVQNYYDRKIQFEFDDEIIKRIVFDDKYIELSYNYDNKLVDIKNELGKNINILYDNSKVISIKMDDDETRLTYSNSKLFRVIDNSELGYLITYESSNIDTIKKINNESGEKSIHGFIYESNKIKVIEEEKYLYINNEKINSTINYLFDLNDSLLIEYREKNNEIKDIIGYEYDNDHCNFSFETKEMDDVIFNLEDDETTGIKTYNVSLPTIIKTDYTLYAIAKANSYDEINEYRITSYCNHIYNVSETKYEMRIILSYDNEEIIYGASFNPLNKEYQLLAIPVTLKEDSNGKAIRPNTINIIIDYSNNRGVCTIKKINLLDCSYIYNEYNSSKNPINTYYSDIKYPKLENSLKKGYIIKSTHKEYEYRKELLSKEIEIIKYQEYDLNDLFIEEKIINKYKSYYYNNNSRLIKMKDSDKNVCLYEYNDKGDLIKEINYNENDSSNRIVNEREYDEGKLIKETNKLGYNSIYKEDENETIIETPSGFIISNSLKSINSDLLSHSLDEENGCLTQLKSGNIKYNFTYDEWKREKYLYLNDELYMTFVYSESLGNKYYVSKYNDNNGYIKITDMYDKTIYIKKRIDGIEEVILKYTYDNKDNLISIKDKNDNVIESYEYIDNVLSKITNDEYIKKISNDIYGNIKSISYDSDKYDYGYNNDNKLISISHNDYNEEIDYDSLGRIRGINNDIYSNNYEYFNINNRTTNLIKIFKQKINNRIIYNKFKYDNNGNIVESIIEHKKNIYHYDGLNRLIRLDSEELNHTYTYSFDDSGNIIEKGIHDLSYDDILINSEYINYDYFNNKLIQYGNNNIEYDNSFRPINYNGNILSWENNKLIRFGNNYYEYDHNGLRNKKITESKVHTYIRDGKKIIKEIIDDGNQLINNESIDNGLNIENRRYEIIYNYGINGIEGFTLNNINYHYIKNIFNDVIEIIDEDYNTYAKYGYDSYGKCNIIENVLDIANINPIRYRSYYYDKETNLYYLNNRYYDPEVMRFISIDDIEYLDFETLGGLNLWIYCNNNPIMYVDPTGHLGILLALLIGAVTGALFGGISAGISSYLSGERGWDFFFDVLGGIIMGAATGVAAVLGGAAGLTAVYGAGAVSGFGLSTGAALGLSMGATAIGGMAKYSLDYAASPNASKFSIENLIYAGINGAIQGLFTFSIAYGMGKLGAFNKTFKINMIDYYSNVGVNVGNFAVGVMQSNIGSISTKFLLSTLPSAVVRLLIDSIIIKER